jgi:hypothetical protein
MGRKKKQGDTGAPAIAPEVKPIIITSAVIKDAQCNYGYEINSGPCKGDKIPSRKGSIIVHDDMITAFDALRVHLAIIDDAFVEADKKFETLDEHEQHPVYEKFRVHGFKIQGSDENEGYILIGEKYVTNGAIALETPKISAGKSYTFYDELKEAIDIARNEVEEYMNGKGEPKMEQGAFEFTKGGKTEEGGEFENPIE